jgi:hypothetical protein
VDAGGCPSVTVFTDNTDFFNGSTFARRHLLVQGISSTILNQGVVSLDSTYFTGSRTTLNGVRGITSKRIRAGLTVALRLTATTRSNLMPAPVSLPVPVASSARSVSLGSTVGVPDIKLMVARFLRYVTVCRPISGH